MPKEIMNDEPKPLLCPLCFNEIADYCADLKCPSCRCDLDGGALQEMLGFKKYIDKNGLVIVGEKVVPVKPVDKLDIVKVINDAARKKMMAPPQYPYKIDIENVFGTIKGVEKAMVYELAIKQSIEQHNNELADVAFAKKWAEMKGAVATETILQKKKQWSKRK